MVEVYESTKESYGTAAWIGANRGYPLWGRSPVNSIQGRPKAASGRIEGGFVVGVEGFKEKPIVEITEHWRSPLGAKAAIEAIARSSAESRAKVEIDGGSVRIHAGSNWVYRILGNVLSSEKVLPVALEVTATAIDEGCKLQARAFDTFGWRLTDRTFFGAEQSFRNRLEDLLESAATAAHVVNRRIGAD